jgi:hypothetical protein
MRAFGERRRKAESFSARPAVCHPPPERSTSKICSRCRASAISSSIAAD